MIRTIRRAAAAVLVVGCLQAHAAGQTATPAPAVTAIRLLHWNSHHGGRRTDGVYDPAGFVSWIVRFDPDIVTLNEVDSTTQANTLLAQLQAQMPGVPWAFHYERGNMILSRLPIAATSSCVVNAPVNRQATHVELRVNGRTVSVWNAHLALDSSTIRTAETRAIQACEEKWPEARVAAGDFNMQAGPAEYKSMTEGHVDAWVAARALGKALNYGGNCDGCTRNTRIDYVFTSKGAWLTLQSAQVFDTRNSKGVMASDHKPLLVVYGTGDAGAVSPVQNLRFVPPSWEWGAP